jgi:hypothetical protein
MPKSSGCQSSSSLAQCMRQLGAALKLLPLGPRGEYGQRARHLIGLDHQGLIHT